MGRTREEAPSSVCRTRLYGSPAENFLQASVTTRRPIFGAQEFFPRSTSSDGQETPPFRARFECLPEGCMAELSPTFRCLILAVARLERERETRADVFFSQRQNSRPKHLGVFRFFLLGALGCSELGILFAALRLVPSIQKVLRVSA